MILVVRGASWSEMSGVLAFAANGAFAAGASQPKNANAFGFVMLVQRQHVGAG